MAGLERNIRPRNALQRFGSNTDRGLRDLRVNLPFTTPRVGLQAGAAGSINTTAFAVTWSNPNSSPGPLEYDVPDAEGSMWASGSPTVVTARRDGLFHVSYQVLATSLTGFLTVNLVSNLSGSLRLSPAPLTSSSVACFAAALDVPLVEDETLSVWVEQSSGTGGLIDTSWTFLAVRLVGVDPT